MKKILLSCFALSLSFIVMNANAEEIQGTVVSKKGDTIHVQPTDKAKPSELKMTDKTKYYQKEEKKIS